MEIHFNAILNATLPPAVCWILLTLLCHLMLNSGWYLLSVYSLLTTADRMTHVCYLLPAAYCYSSVCHLLINAGWYLLSIIATCWLLLTEWRMSAHVCCLLHAANLLPVTWCLMMADICCRILLLASCLPTNWCPFTEVCRLLHWYSCSSVCHLMLNVDLYPLSVIATSCLPTTYDCFPAFRLIPIIVATGWYQLPANTSYPFPPVDCCSQTYSF